MPFTATIAPAAAAPRRPRPVARAVGRGPGAIDEPRARPAVRAGVRLGVEAAVARVLVLGPAARAHREAGHRRQRPVVGDAAHDREARAAVRAVDERVAVAAVGGVEQLGEAVVAGRGVGRDRARPARPPRTLARIAKPRSPARPATAAARRARRAPAAAPRRGSRARKRSTRRRVALDLDQHAALVVAARSRRGRARRASRYTYGPEADALDRALDPHAHARTGPRRQRLTARARPARAARGRRSPAPPGSAGCAASGVTTTWSASPSAATRPPS